MVLALFSYAKNGSDGRRVFARREAFRARPLDPTNHIPSNLRLAELTSPCVPEWDEAREVSRLV